MLFIDEDIISDRIDTTIDYQRSRLELYQEEFELFESMCRADIREMNMIHEDASEEEKNKNKEFTWENIKAKIIHLIETAIQFIKKTIENIKKAFIRYRGSEAVRYYKMNKEKFIPILSNSNIEFSRDFAIPNIDNILHAISSFNNSKIDFKEDKVSAEDAYAKIMGTLLNDKDIPKSNLENYLEDLFLIKSTNKHMDGKYIKRSLELFDKQPFLGVTLAEACKDKLSTLEDIVKLAPSEYRRNITISIAAIKDFQSMADKIFIKGTRELDGAVSELYRKIKDK